VRAARVLGHVSADRADDLRGRIGRVEVRRPDGCRDLDVRHAGLDDDATALEVDLQHAAHPRDRDEHALGDRQRAAREARARAARDPRHAGVRARAHDVAHLRGAARQDDRAGRRAVLQQPVGFVRAQLDRLRQDVLFAADRAKAFKQRTSERGRLVVGDVQQRSGHGTAGEA
jgi:hypothetical protein